MHWNNSDCSQNENPRLHCWDEDFLGSLLDACAQQQFALGLFSRLHHLLHNLRIFR